MIDKSFWEKIAENWCTDNDGTNIPETDLELGDLDKELEGLKEDLNDDELDDILGEIDTSDD